MSTSSAKKPPLDVYSKIVFIGNPGVGKTSLIRRILDQDILSVYSPTLWVRYHNLDVQQNDSQYYLQLWDVSGNEIYSDIIPSILKGASVVILVFDYKDDKSQNEFIRLYTKVLENVSPTQLLLVGNKFENIKKEIPKVLSSWIKEHNLMINPVSAKENTGKSLLLRNIIKLITDIPNSNKTTPIEVRIGTPDSE